MQEKLILTDSDGVILDWEAGFEEWMAEKGYVKLPDYDVKAYSLSIHYGIPKEEIKHLIKQFNESAAIGYLPMYADAIECIPKLYDMGYDFHMITSLSLDKFAKKARIENLNRYFPFDIFNSHNVTCLDVGADKGMALLPYKNRNLFWIEDKYENAMDGHILGLNSLLLIHDHNGHIETPFPKVKNWKEIYEIVISSENQTL